MNSEHIGDEAGSCGGVAAPLPRNEYDLLLKDRDRWRRTATDRQYMIDHLVQMLGVKGRQVWDLWQAKGVQRIHVSWGPAVEQMAGEDIAQLHLQIEEACKEAVPINDIDGHLAALPTPVAAPASMTPEIARLQKQEMGG